MMNLDCHRLPLRQLAIMTCCLLAGWSSAASRQTAAADAPDVACKLVASDADIDYGRFSPYDLPPVAPSASVLPLGKRIITLHADCGTPRRMALFYRGETRDANTFRFGSEGRLTLRVVRAQLDGRPVTLGQVKSASQRPASTAPTVDITPGIGALATGTGQRLSLQVEIEAVVPREAMHPRTEQTWRTAGRFALETYPAP